MEQGTVDTIATPLGLSASICSDGPVEKSVLAIEFRISAEFREIRDSYFSAKLRSAF